jgi:hypothetical protein
MPFRRGKISPSLHHRFILTRVEFLRFPPAGQPMSDRSTASARMISLERPTPVVHLLREVGRDRASKPAGRVLLERIGDARHALGKRRTERRSLQDAGADHPALIEKGSRSALESDWPDAAQVNAIGHLPPAHGSGRRPVPPGWAQRGVGDLSSGCTPGTASGRIPAR